MDLQFPEFSSGNHFVETIQVWFGKFPKYLPKLPNGFYNVQFYNCFYPELQFISKDLSKYTLFRGRLFPIIEQNLLPFKKP